MNYKLRYMINIIKYHLMLPKRAYYSVRDFAFLVSETFRMARSVLINMDIYLNELRQDRKRSEVSNSSNKGEKI